MSEECSNCQRLEAKNQQLQEHVRQLEEYAKKLEKHIERLQEALRRVWQYVIRVLGETRPILSRRSGVPRGNWAYCLGADEVAEEVESLVQEAANG